MCSMMEKININLVKPGSIVETDIHIKDSGRFLIPRYSILTEKMILKLKEMGIEELYIKPNDNIKITSENIELSSNHDLSYIYQYSKFIVDIIINRKDIKPFFNIVDDNIFQHSIKTSLISTMIGMNIKYYKNQEDLEQLAISGLLHDIGKSKISGDILNKPGKLTLAEFEQIKKHPQFGFDLTHDKFSNDVCSGILFHHENEDGSGYPNNLFENQIPINAKIIHIADVFSALMSTRTYKKAWSLNDTITYLTNENKKYNDVLINILLESLPFYYKGDLVLLKDGTLATVLAQTNENNILTKIYGEQGTKNIDLSHIKRKVKKY